MWREGGGDYLNEEASFDLKFFTFRKEHNKHKYRESMVNFTNLLV